MKAGIIIVGIVCALGAVQANEWKPGKEFLRAVRFVESSNGQFVEGDEGQSLGDFQLSEGAWLDVNNWRKARYLKMYHYEEAVFNSFINRVYAANYLTILESELRRKLGRAPSHAEIYAAYNMGLAMFAQCGFKLSRVNPVTREKCRQIDELLAAKRS